MSKLIIQRSRQSKRQGQSALFHSNLELTLISILVMVCLTVRTATAQETPIPLSQADIQQIVDAHNFFRGMVQPPASNMQRIEWNSELAMVAQRYAETCMFGPNPDRAQQAQSFDTVGENRAFGRSTNYTDLIERGWFVQRANFDFDANMCLSPGACDEYIQLVWAESNMVGCGVANCPTVIGLPILPNAVVFVCNYAPEGNIAGQLPYFSGEPCSQCPQGFDFCVENLCSSTMAPPTTTEIDTPTTTQELVTTTTTDPLITTELTTTTTVAMPTTTVAMPTTTVAPPTTTEDQSQPSTTPTQAMTTPSVGMTTAVTARPTVKPTKNPLTIWQIIWYIIKNKQKPYIVPTSIPERTRSRSRSRSKSSRRRTKTRTEGSSRSNRRAMRTKSKSSKRRSRKFHSRRQRGRGGRRRG